MFSFLNKKYRLRDMPIRRKLLSVTIVVAFLVLSVSAIGFQIVTANTNQLLYTQTASSLAVISDKIASRLDNLVDVSLYVATNQEFQNNLSIVNGKDQTSARSFSRSKITSLLYRTFHSDFITMSIFPENSSSIVLGFDSLPEDKDVYERAAKAAEKAKGAVVWVPTDREDGSILLVRNIYNVKLPFLESMGMLMVRIDLDKIIESSTRDLLPLKYNLTIRQAGHLLYPRESDHAILSNTLSNDEPYAIRSAQGERYFVTRSPIHTASLDWEFMLGIPYNDVFRSLVVANALFILCLILAVIVAMLLSRRMFGSINRDISLLTSKMNQVRKGNLEPCHNPSQLGQDELGMLNRHFDEMTADFKQVIEDNYVKQLLLTQTQLKALEQQINPHFLYNVLESINWFARFGDGKRVSTMVQSLGHLLRSTLSQNEDLISLQRELDILESYLSIQRIRFPDTLRVTLHADKEALTVMIPKMSIQPLVENAIIHSLEENVGTCHIDIRVVLQNDFLQVSVENDGSEIDLDILEKLQENKVQPKGHGIGLINIDSRIKLLFGQEYGLHLENSKEHVIVSFSIPIDLGETNLLSTPTNNIVTPKES